MFFNYYSLEALAAVVKEKSFSKASQSLHITQSAVSQRISELERLIGQPLLIRSPAIRPTVAGQEILSHFRKVSMLEEEVKSRWLVRHPLSGPKTISIALNTESLSTWFIEAVQPIISQGHIIIDLMIDDQERTIELLKTGRVWGCITSIAKPPYGCTSTVLGTMIYKCVATPEFAKKYFGKGINSRTLLNAPAAIYGESDYMHDHYLKKHFRGYGEGKPMAHHVPSPQGLVDFAVKGLAFALLPEPSIRYYLKNGQLMDLLPDKPYKLPLYWQTQELQTEFTRELSQRIVVFGSSQLK